MLLTFHHVLAETSNGNILVSVKDKNTNKYRLLRAKAPVWGIILADL